MVGEEVEIIDLTDDDNLDEPGPPDHVARAIEVGAAALAEANGWEEGTEDYDNAVMAATEIVAALDREFLLRYT